jgi:hypothetical protein
VAGSLEDFARRRGKDTAEALDEALEGVREGLADLRAAGPPPLTV